MAEPEAAPEEGEGQIADEAMRGAIQAARGVLEGQLGRECEVALVARDHEGPGQDFGVGGTGFTDSKRAEHMCYLLGAGLSTILMETPDSGPPVLAMIAEGLALGAEQRRPGFASNDPSDGPDVVLTRGLTARVLLLCGMAANGIARLEGRPIDVVVTMKYGREQQSASLVGPNMQKSEQEFEHLCMMARAFYSLMGKATEEQRDRVLEYVKASLTGADG